MEILPTRLLSWKAFREAWPEGSVLAPNNPLWRRWLSRLIARPPIFFLLPFFRRTLPAPDRRLPEGELGLGVVLRNPETGRFEARFYSSRAVKAAGVAHDRLGGALLAIVSDPWSGNVLAFKALAGGRELRLSWDAGGKLCESGGSCFDLAGKCTSGPLLGTGLQPVPAVSSRWYGFVATYPEAMVWSGSSILPTGGRQ